jgi:hypothetical protein
VLGRAIVPATSTLARSAWTITDDVVTSWTASEKVMVNGPLSGADAVGAYPEMTGTVASTVQENGKDCKNPDWFWRLTVKVCGPSSSGP